MHGGSVDCQCVATVATKHGGKRNGEMIMPSTLGAGSMPAVTLFGQAVPEKQRYVLFVYRSNGDCTMAYFRTLDAACDAIAMAWQRGDCVETACHDDELGIMASLITDGHEWVKYAWNGANSDAR